MNFLRMEQRNRWTVAGIIVLVCVGLSVYWNALAVDFWTDDYQFLETAGRLDWQAYLREYFDPSVQWHWYRPVQGLAWWLGYQLFRVAPAGYHLVQVLLHVANSLWLYALTARATRRWRIGFLAALLYIVLPAYNLAVYWPGVADPLAAFFFLAAMWLWFDYLESGGMRRFGFAFVTFVFALFAKEIGIVLPAVLFLADRWIIAKPISFRQLVQRYALFIVTVAIFVLLEYRVLTRGVFTRQLGYGIGGHVLDALGFHLTTLAFPWHAPTILKNILLALILALVAFAMYRRMWKLLFLGAAMVLTLLPILPFPPGIAFAARYLYLPLMGSMIGLALAIDFVLRARTQSTVWFVTAIGIAILLWWHGGIVAEDGANFAATTRAERLQFRPVFQRYPAFGPGTLLYFIAPTHPNLSGLMFTRYGAKVITSSTEMNFSGNLRDYAHAFVFYRDEQNIWRDQTVEPNIDLHITPTLPSTFDQSILLERAELVRQRVKRGEALVVLVAWHAAGKIDQEYTAFTHLIDANGNRIDGIDSPPRGGNPPMTRWLIGESKQDAIILTIDPAIAPGMYALHIGLYKSDTLERLTLSDGRDHVTLEFVEVIE
jgi:hypothetical protein